MHEPINALEIAIGYSFFNASSFNLETGLAKSGVWGPTMCGSKELRSISIT